MFVVRFRDVKVNSVFLNVIEKQIAVPCVYSVVEALVYHTDRAIMLYWVIILTQVKKAVAEEAPQHSP